MVPLDSPDPDRFHDFEKGGWQRAAGYYGKTFGLLTEQTAEPMLDAVGAGPGMRLLDVATGPGYLAGAAIRRGARVVGVDFSPSMIAEAILSNPDVTFRVGDAEALSFADNSFDAVVMNFGLLHLARPEAAIAESFRVLAPPGRYAFTVWAAPDTARGFGIVLKAIETHGTLDVGLPPGPPFFRFSEPEECRRALKAAGFQDVVVEHLPLEWRLPSVDAVFYAMMHGGVRTSAVLQAQTPAALRAIREDIERALEPYRSGDGLVIPMPAILAAGRK
jgi:SAM-dependent methyltransferase